MLTTFVICCEIGTTKQDAAIELGICGKVVRVNKRLADLPLDASAEVFLSAIQDQADAAVFFPTYEAKYKLIKFASAQQKYQVKLPKKLRLLGGASLYSSYILQQGKDAIEGLVFVVPWFDAKSNSNTFAKEARNRWEDPISWETAISYDATQAFIKAMSLSDNPSRQSVLEKLPSINLSPDESSGNGLKFIDGERKQEPVLVKVLTVIL